MANGLGVEREFRGLGLGNVSGAPGVGLANPAALGPTPSRPAALPLETSLPLAPPRRSGAPSFEDNPLGAIGFVLQSAAAGFQGRELPAERLKRDQIAADEVALRRMRLGLDTLSTLSQQAEKIPFAQRAEFFELAGRQFSNTFGPEFVDILKRTVSLPDPQRILALTGEFAPALQSMFGDDFAAQERFVLDPKNREFLEDGVRRRNLGPAVGKVRALTTRLPPALRQKITDSGLADADGNLVVTPGDLRTLNGVLPKNSPLRLTPQELLAVELEMERRPEFAREVGLRVVPEVSIGQAAERAGAITKAQKLAELEVLGATKTSALTEGDGSVKTAASSELRRQAAMLHGGFVDPRTGETGGLTREAAQNAIAVAAEAESLIEKGEANSLAEATQKASEKIGIPTAEDPEIQIPKDTRNELLAQNAEIASILPFARTLLADVKIGVGGISNLSALMDATLGQVLDLLDAEDPTIGEDTQEARQNLRLFNQHVKRAIVNNPRFPVAEQNTVLDLLPDPDEFFTNPASAVRRFRQLIEFMDRKLVDNGALLQGRLPEGAIQRDDKGGFDSVDAVRAATRGELRAFVNKATIDELGALPEDVRQAIFDGLQ